MEKLDKHYLKDTFELIKARARHLKNINNFYKWVFAAGLTGILGGLASVLFNAILNSSLWGFNKLISVLPDPRLIAIIPAVGGLLSGIIRYLTVPEAFDSCCATDNMIDVVHKNHGKTKVITPFATIITAALTIGSGGSAGRECPTALIGTGFGSITSDIIKKFHLDKIFRFKFSKEDYRTLAICGSAAGLGAIFRAPVGAAFFSASVLYVYGMENDLILPALISSITAYLIFSLFYGFEPLFKAPFAWSFNFFDLVWVALIGVVASLVGLAYIKVFYGFFHKFRKLNIPDYVKPALGGLLVGLVIIFFPRVFGMGYQTIQDAIDYKIAIGLMVLLIFAKIIATSFSIGSGGAGGVIAPSLFIGAVIGGLMGNLAMTLFPNSAVHPALYVIAAMGAFYSSVGKVPLATAILLSEATRNFSIIVPLIASNVFGFLASSKYTIYESQHADAKERGDFLKELKVRDIMRKRLVSISPKATANDLLKKTQETGHHGFPVTSDSTLLGIITWRDVHLVPMKERDMVKVKDVMNKHVYTVSPEASVKKTLNKLNKCEASKLFVIDPDNPKKLVGMITKHDIISRYLKSIEN